MCVSYDCAKCQQITRLSPQLYGIAHYKTKTVENRNRAEFSFKIQPKSDDVKENASYDFAPSVETMLAEVDCANLSSSDTCIRKY